MGLTPATPFDEYLIPALVALRTEIRWAEYRVGFGWDWNTGGCARVSEELVDDYGWEQDGGCYVADPFSMAGESGAEHIGHLWNILPDGRIIDVTVDQFREGEDVRVTTRDDARYVARCNCEHAA